MEDRWIHGRQIWKRPIVWVAVTLVINVVQDEAVEVQVCQSGRGDLGDLPDLLVTGAAAGWGNPNQEGPTSATTTATNFSPPPTSPSISSCGWWRTCWT